MFPAFEFPVFGSSLYTVLFFYTLCSQRQLIEVEFALCSRYVSDTVVCTFLKLALKTDQFLSTGSDVHSQKGLQMNWLLTTAFTQSGQVLRLS